MIDDDLELLDAGDEYQVYEQQKLAGLVREREVEELRVLLTSRGGRAFIWRLLEYCGTYHAAPGELQDMARFEGRRDVGLWLVNECFTSDAEAYTLMRQEVNIAHDGKN